MGRACNEEPPPARPTLWITVGLPASGKSSWARRQLTQAPPGKITRVNRDSLRAMMLAPGYRHPPPPATGNPSEALITTAQLAAIRELLAAGYDVICDDTNLHDEHRRVLADTAHAAGAASRVVDFTRVPVQTCIARDERRSEPERVGQDVIRAMASLAGLRPEREVSPPTDIVTGGA
jgi:predicted kinase